MACLYNFVSCRCTSTCKSFAVLVILLLLLVLCRWFNNQHDLHCHAWLCPGATSATPGMFVHPACVCDKPMCAACKHSTSPLHAKFHHETLPADKGGFFRICARQDDTSISITASPPQTHNPKDTTPAHLQQLRTPALSCQMLSAPVLQTQHHSDHVPGTSQELQCLSDASVPSHPGTPSSACQGGLGTTPGTSKGSQNVWTAEPGASPFRRWMLADANRVLQYERAMQTVVARAGPGAVCIMSGAAASLAVVAAACPNVDQVICLQVQQSTKVGELASLLNFGALSCS